MPNPHPRTSAWHAVQQQNRQQAQEQTQQGQQRQASHPHPVRSLRRAWYRNGVVRVAVGIAASVALVLSIKQSIPTPEEIASAPVLPSQDQSVPPIAPSQPVEMYISSAGIHAEFDQQPCRVRDGAIDPENMGTACIYTAPDRPYSLPGTTAEDLVVIAGHTGAGVAGIFDNLYDGKSDRHMVAVGDALYLRTEASGADWLVYSATDLHSPEKSSLADDSDVWGDAAQPGRLLTISCIQPANLWQSAVRNAVVGWQFTGIAMPESVHPDATP